MAFGPDHVKPAGLHHLVVFGLHLLLEGLQRVGPLGLVFLGGFHGIETLLAQLQVGQELGVATEHDVGTASRHVGGHGHRSLAARLRDHGGLPLVLLRVEDLVRDALLLQHPGQQLGLRDRGGADEHGLPILVAEHDILNDRLVLGLLRAVDPVALIDADHRHVRWNGNDPEAVDLLELGLLGLRGTRHAGEFVVHAEVVLQGDGGEGLVFVLDLHPFLRLEGLVQALVVAAPGQGASGVFVDDEDLVAQHHVVLVPFEQFLGLDGVVQVADERGVGGFVEVVDAEPVLHHLDACARDGDRPFLLVHLVVLVAFHGTHHPRENRVPLVGVLGRAGDDQRGAGLVDQDRIHLIDDGEVVAALHEVLAAERHVVAQVVETEFVVGAVGDVGPVGETTFGGRHRGQDDADLQAEEMMDPPHLLGLVLGQVVVGGDDVHTITRQCIQVGRKSADEGFSLAGFHLRDVAPVECRAAHDLNVEMTFVEHSN